MKNLIYSKITETLSKPYARRLVKEVDDTYTASILEFPGCVASGNNPIEALEKLESVAESWVEAALNSGFEFRDPIDSGHYSGKVALRLPRMLHKQVAEMAMLDETSINQFIVMAVSSHVSGKIISDKLKDALSSFSSFEFNFKQIRNQVFIIENKSNTADFLKPSAVKTLNGQHLELFA